ncbi:CHAT domain-containing protein [Altererythrobacter sp. KTW20L]|uniref:CHAT domain-containing tetratricopeptide repeat protein n=1 Tax=Altererythrobacter sp. KTW20L TaxID=2942210 RepID=UPI0020BF6D53|nr:CHAT domain-containing tetratricopeptide repeat protein [Altererythrobacter sp. KTW20L]MCL6250120.1 CHAT domain-containing protein [Altererythrobacter sp. KTW20L]
MGIRGQLGAVRRVLATTLALLAAGLALVPVAAGAQETGAQEAGAPTLPQMRARDRLAAPEGELAAWQAFATRVATDPAIPPAMRAETHLGLAIALFYAKDYDASWQEISIARRLLDEAGTDEPFESELLAYEAIVLIELGRLDEAGIKAATALDLAQEQGQAGLARQALAHNAQALLAFARNDIPAAERGFCTARDLGLAASSPNHPMIVNDASSCGVVKYYLERPDTVAAMRLASDHAFAHLPPDHPKMGNVLNGAYAVLLRYGRYAEAEPLIRRHLDLERSLRSGDADDLYDPLSMLGRVLEMRGNYADAEGIFTAAAAMADRLRNQSQPYTRGQAQINLAGVIAHQGRLDEAEQMARRGLAMLAEDLEPGDWNVGSGEVQLASHLDRLGRRDEALALAESGLATLAGALDPGHSEVLGARLIRARILAGLGRGDEALDEARGATGQFEAQMFDLAASEEERIALSRVLPAAFADYIDAALQAGALEDAVHAAQLYLLSELAVPNARIAAASVAREEGLGAMVERMDRARGQVDELGAAFTRAQGEGAAEAAAIAASLAAARGEAAAAQADLLAAFPGYAALARPKVSSLADLQAGLAPGELLVMPVALPTRAVTIVVSRDAVQWGGTAIDPMALDALATRLRDSAQATGAFDVEAAQDMFRLVFPQALRGALEGADTLLFPASGYLARLSPAVLLAGPAADGDLADAPWLVRSHAIRIMAEPGARRTEARALAGRGFLGVGAPDALPGGEDGSAFRAGTAALPPLPRAREELDALAAALGTPDPLVLAGAGATEAALAGLDLASYGVIAFATHGLVGGELAGLDEPALLLTADDPLSKAGDGLLTASEIAAMRLDADWVILSACETAAGESASAPGYSGLARAFVQAGARSLMLSHWRVRDDAAAFLSVETLRRAAQGETRAGALRQAQLALMARADVPQAGHPAVWAPFVILEN